jgi:CDP-2,3-bis-(O-geranylgeranyl)-sn-glycerol synthase
MPESPLPPLALEIAGTTYLLLPLLGGAALHGLCMKYGWLGFLAKPIDGGRTFRGRPIFGHSKTWRGPVCVAAGAAAVWGLQQGLLHRVDALAALELVDSASLAGWWFGAAAGAAAELAELPNSFVKRRLGIAPGKTARGPLSVLFYLWDQLDLLLGYWLVLALGVPVTPLRVAVSVLVVVAIHPLLTLLGYLLGMRPTAR